MTDQEQQQQWDAAVAEAGYLPTSEYVKKWAATRAALEAAQEANRQSLDALEEATIAYHDAVNRWLKRVWG